MSTVGFTTPYNRTCQDGSEQNVPRPRLYGRYATRFGNVQVGADLLLFAVAGAIFYWTVFLAPSLMLWPAATNGTLQHWIVGIVLAGLLWETVVHDRGAIYRDRSLTHDLSRLSPCARWEIERTDGAITRSPVVTDALLFALYLYPARTLLGTLWQSNDADAVVAQAPHVLIHLVPAAALVALRLGTAYVLHTVAACLERRQERAEIEADMDADLSARP